MTTPLRTPNSNAPNVDVITLDLSAIQNPNVMVIPNGTPVWTLLFVVPPGVYAELWLNGRFPLQLDVGSSSYKTDIDCQPFIGGYSIKTNLAYPGQQIKIFVGGGVRTS